MKYIWSVVIRLFVSMMVWVMAMVAPPAAVLWAGLRFMMDDDWNGPLVSWFYDAKLGWMTLFIIILVGWVFTGWAGWRIHCLLWRRTKELPKKQSSEYTLEWEETENP